MNSVVLKSKGNQPIQALTSVMGEFERNEKNVTNKNWIKHYAR